MMPIVGQITNYFKPKYLIAAGMLTVGLGITGMWPQASFDYFAWARVYQTVSLPFLFIPITTASYAGLPPDKTNEAASLINVGRNLSGSIGVSLATALLTARTISPSATCGIDLPLVDSVSKTYQPDSSLFHYPWVLAS
jgi:MFS transporter, DHA2 family, multidrug resistance protein